MNTPCFTLGNVRSSSMTYFHPLAAGLSLAGVVLLVQEPRARLVPIVEPAISREFVAPLLQPELDPLLLSRWVVETEHMIALARLGRDRARAPELADFAATLVEQNAHMLQRLHGAAERNRGVKLPPRKLDAGGDPKGAYEAGDAPKSVADATAPTIALDHEALVRDLMHQRLTSAAQLLEHKEGVEFDRCFAKLLLEAQVAAVDMMDVFQDHASYGLRLTLDEGLKSARSHLQRIRELERAATTAVQLSCR
jgi:hypothetical protein